MRLRLTIVRRTSRPAAAAFLSLVSSLLVAPPAAADPLPSGKFIPTSAVPNDCPPGFTCSGFEVAVPGVTRNARGFLAVAPHTTAAPRGLVMLFTGGSGQEWWTDQTPENLPFTDDLRAAGFSVAQVRWGNNWLESSPGNDAGTAHLAGRPATVIRHVHDTYYTPLGAAPAAPGYGGFVITGNSGGASQVSYALSHYGLEDILDVVIPTGGPPHANLSRAVLEPDPSRPWHFDRGTRNFIDRGFGFFDGNGPAARQDESFRSRWDAESVGTGGSDYVHPETRVHFIMGSSDRGMQALGGDYYNRLLAEGSPMVSWEIAARTGHGVFGTPEGRAALWGAITAVPEPTSLTALAPVLLLVLRRRYTDASRRPPPRDVPETAGTTRRSSCSGCRTNWRGSAGRTRRRGTSAT